MSPQIDRFIYLTNQVFDESVRPVGQVACEPLAAEISRVDVQVGNGDGLSKLALLSPPGHTHNDKIYRHGFGRGRGRGRGRGGTDIGERVTTT